MNLDALSPEEKVMFTNYYKLSPANISTIKEMRSKYGQTTDEIARRFSITPPDVKRILHPPKNYGRWTAEQKLKHWKAGKKRSETVKKNRDARANNYTRNVSIMQVTTKTGARFSYRDYKQENNHL